jgi:hypothetical protein
MTRRVDVLTVRLVSLPGLASTPAKRGRGRPKGSKNKKSTTAGTAASTSEVAPAAAGEKRKRGRPPKVRSAELFPKCSSNLRDCVAQERPGGGCVG